MKLQKTWAGVLLSGLLLVGCGGGSSSSDNHEDVLPAGLTFVMFDNATGEQYSYETDHEEFDDMNDPTGTNYDMTGKSGKLVVWTHRMVDSDGNETEEQKIVMLNNVDYNILNDGNVTYEHIHYLGHFHTNEETNESEFAAHSADEFDPAVETNTTILAKKQAALDSLSEHLLEQEAIRTELEEALLNENATGDLCNFIVLGEHEEHDDNVTNEEHGAPHIALTTDGYVYVFEENATTQELVQDGIYFLLEGVTNCTETESDILQVGEHGVAIFSAQTQKLYMVDKHEAEESSIYSTDFHVHSTVEISEIMPAGFTPTSVAVIGEGEHDHEH